MHMTLDADKILATVDTLARRIGERFPQAGLARLAEKFTLAARTIRADALALERPNWRLRVVTVAILAGGFTLFGFVVRDLRFNAPVEEVGTLVQILEPAANIAILVALGIVFIVRLEMRWKRAQAIASLHSLRSMIHVIDMHQLTKDPSVLLAAAKPTASSPKRTMSEIELQRYLDYCSEMLSLAGKLAALYTQSVQDQVVIDMANEIEELSTNLSRKIWQKIMILDRAVPDGRVAGPTAEAAQ
jgi:hypothetical protein